MTELVGSYPVFYERWMRRLYCMYVQLLWNVTSYKCDLRSSLSQRVLNSLVLSVLANLLRFSSGHQLHIHNQEIQSNQKSQNQASSSRCLKFENISNKALNYFSSATHHPFNMHPE